LLFTEAAIRYCIRTGTLEDESTFQLRKQFGTATFSSVSLYQAISGGRDWFEIYDTIAVLGTEYQLAFLTFQAISFIVLLNIITAVFVESALERSKSDRSFMVQGAIRANNEFLGTMRKMFHKIDEDGGGEIALSELKAHLRTKEIGAYFDSLGIDANQAGSLFNLLDTDGSGTIDIKEFMFGCIRIRGEAKSLDMAIISQELKWLKESMIEGFGTITDVIRDPDGFFEDEILEDDEDSCGTKDSPRSSFSENEDVVQVSLISPKGGHGPARLSSKE